MVDILIGDVLIEQHGTTFAFSQNTLINDTGHTGGKFFNVMHGLTLRYIYNIVEGAEHQDSLRSVVN